MRVVFVATHEAHLGTTPSIGLEYLASIGINKGHEVYGLVDTLFDARHKVTGDEKRNLKTIKDLQPDLVAFSVTTARYQWCLKFGRMIKKRFPGVTIMFGGYHPTLAPENVIGKSCVDVLCVGEGEGAFSEYLGNPERVDIENLWYKKGSEIIRNDIRPLVEDLDTIPFPNKEIWRGIIPDKCYEIYDVISSRNCPFNCVYCWHTANRKIYHGMGKYFRRRSVNNVITELELAKKKYPIKEIVFNDDILTEDVSWFGEFSDEYRRRVDIPFICLSNPLIIDEERVKLLKQAGCRFVMWGIQSGDEGVRNKIMRRYDSNSKVIDVAKSLHEHRVPFSVDHLFGIPHCDSEESLSKSVNLYNEIRPTSISTYRLYPYLKTDVVDMCVDAGVLSEQDLVKLEEGTFQEITIRAVPDSRYHGYSSLFTFLPLLPKGLVRYIHEHKTLMGGMKNTPMFLIWIAKAINNWRAGNIRMLRWHLENLPGAVMRRLGGYRGEMQHEF